MGLKFFLVKLANQKIFLILLESQPKEELEHLQNMVDEIYSDFVQNSFKRKKNRN